MSEMCATRVPLVFAKKFQFLSLMEGKQRAKQAVLAGFFFFFTVVWHEVRKVDVKQDL